MPPWELRLPSSEEDGIILWVRCAPRPKVGLIFHGFLALQTKGVEFVYYHCYQRTRAYEGGKEGCIRGFIAEGMGTRLRSQSGTEVALTSIWVFQFLAPFQSGAIEFPFLQPDAQRGGDWRLVSPLSSNGAS